MKTKALKQTLAMLENSNLLTLELLLFFVATNVACLPREIIPILIGKAKVFGSFQLNLPIKVPQSQRKVVTDGAGILEVNFQSFRHNLETIYVSFSRHIS